MTSSSLKKVYTQKEVWFSLFSSSISVLQLSSKESIDGYDEECGYLPNWIVSFSSLSSWDRSTSGLSFHILWKVDFEQWFMLSSWSSQVPSNWPFESLITIDCRWWSRWYLAKCGEKLQVRKEASFVPTPTAETRGLHSTRWVIRQFEILSSQGMTFHISPA